VSPDPHRFEARVFAAFVRYPEATVNEILRRYHEDVATLRRSLIDEELMQRNAGLYWRTGTVPRS
jgi:hypothetical protein